MSAATQMVSIGDGGVLNREISAPLSEVWIDRDLSWLDFNDRVLAEALDSRTPLLERVKFLAIFTSNLDEFFMKRVSVLRDKNAPQQTALLELIHMRLMESLRRQALCFRDELLPALASNGIHLVQWDSLTPAQCREAEGYFDSEVRRRSLPSSLTPLIPFPFFRTCRFPWHLCCATRKERLLRTRV